jgi:DNA-directed RNA polymerase subunit E'/Rpb7
MTVLQIQKIVGIRPDQLHSGYKNMIYEEVNKQLLHTAQPDIGFINKVDVIKITPYPLNKTKILFNVLCEIEVNEFPSIGDKARLNITNIFPQGIMIQTEKLSCLIPEKLIQGKYDASNKTYILDNGTILSAGTDCDVEYVNIKQTQKSIHCIAKLV